MSEEVDFEEEMVESTPAPPAETQHAEETNTAAAEKVVAKGRGHSRRDEEESRYEAGGGVFERIEQSTGPGPIQCKDSVYRSRRTLVNLIDVLLNF